MSPRVETVGLIGAGALATALGRAARAGGLEIAFVRSRGAARAVALGRSLGAPREACGASEPPWPDVDVLCLCVPDDRIAEVAATCAASWPSTPELVIHTSGALPAGILDDFARRGSRTASVHPLMTFPAGAADARGFAGIPASVETARAADAPRALAFARCLGLDAFPIATDDKVQVHAAAVFLGNYLVALASAAERCLPSREAAARPRLVDLLPLARAVLDNLERTLARGGTVRAALSGPLARGDRDVVARHRERLRTLVPDGASLDALYRALARATLHWLAPQDAEAWADLLADGAEDSP